ncbi:Guanine nucleotide-binding protein alpha-2 subunit [Maudiozyma exigua]|uniref:Guanine nucleotide-binding protein alpha-2 subunit n=1 Tax=Maudiozyma exigua TaxID=34358 RepID=A0A9P6WCY7_MAUEX|nr:Guanine nucleotide-binding protein alpha-2 subunit [Kazachstania exigua]
MGICGSKQETATTTGTSKNETTENTQRNVVKRENNVVAVKKQKESNTTATNKDIANSPSSSNDIIDNKTGQRELKVLLLGAGESGKSTVLQQLKILRKNGFTEAELYSYVPIIYGNIIEIGKSLIEAREKFNLPLDNNLTQEEIDELISFRFDTNVTKNLNDDSQLNNGKITNIDENIQNMEITLANSNLPQNFYTILTKLWTSKETQNLIKSTKSSSFYLMDSTPYFMDPKNLKRIFHSENYKPNLQDILRSRQKTSGIFDTYFDMGSNLKFHIYDVGGQRSERKKWIHCFDNVTLAIFCVSLSEYDQFLLEDRSQNRFQESLILFENIVNSRWFANSSIVLFLNKIDLFAEKLKIKPLENYFPDYTGGSDINKATKYILWRFVKLNRANLNIYPHITQATDTSNIKLVFAAIKETILENSLKETGVIV